MLLARFPSQCEDYSHSTNTLLLLFNSVTYFLWLSGVMFALVCSQRVGEKSDQSFRWPIKEKPSPYCIVLGKRSSIYFFRSRWFFFLSISWMPHRRHICCYSISLIQCPTMLIFFGIDVPIINQFSTSAGPFSLCLQLKLMCDRPKTGNIFSSDLF